MKRSGAQPSFTGKIRTSIAPGLLAVLLLIPLTTPREGSAQTRPIFKVALAGEVAPGTGGATFTSFDEPFVNTAGDVTFGACYSGGAGDVGSGSGCGVFFSRGGVVSYVALEGQVVPGVGTLSGTFDGPILNNAGTVAFAALQITGSARTALFQKTVAGPLTVLAKRGDAIPGGAAAFLGFDDMAENSAGDVAFIAIYSPDPCPGPSGCTNKHTGVFLKPSGGPIVTIILEGDPVPAGAITCPSGLQTSGEGDSIDGPWMNDSQVVAFKIDGPCGNDSSGLDQVLVKRPGFPLTTFVAEGDPAPAFLGGGTLGGITLGRPGLNNAKTLVFRTNGGDDLTAILTQTLGQSPVLCVKEGSPAPGTVGTFAGFAENAAINQSGHVFVQADVAGDPNVSAGIFTCRNGSVQAMALQGDPIPGTSNTFTVDIEEGSISDSGCVVFLHENSDPGPWGVFVSCEGVAVPTLSEWAMILMAVLLVGFGVKAIRRRDSAGGLSRRPA